MTTYFAVVKKRVDEAMSAENGYGDHPSFRYERLGPVRATSPQSARTQFKKVLPGTEFSARFSPWLFAAEDLGPWADAPINVGWSLFSRFHLKPCGSPKVTS